MPLDEQARGDAFCLHPITNPARFVYLDATGAILLARLSGGGTDPRIIGAANAIAKIERASQAAMASYFRLRHGSTQTIRVEKIEIQSGAQAVVGQVTTAN